MDVNIVLIERVNRCEYLFIVKKIYIWRCSVRLYLQLFVGGLMSYWRFLCLFVYGGVQHMFYCVCLHLAFCVPNVASSLNCPFLISCSVFSNVYLTIPTMCLLSPLFSYPMTYRFCFLRRSNHYFKIVVTVDTLRVPELRSMDMICRMGCR